MDHQNVLNGRVFDIYILTEFGMISLDDLVTIQKCNHFFELPAASYLHELEEGEFYYKLYFLEDRGIKTSIRYVENCLDEEILGIRTIAGCKPTWDFISLSTKLTEVKLVGLPKKCLKGEY